MMSEDIAVQILTQTSENIQKLFDLSTRIDERVKGISAKQHEIEQRLNDLSESHNEMLQNIAVLESQGNSEFPSHRCPHKHVIDNTCIGLAAVDKRLSVVELISSGQQNTFKRVTDFVIQLVWIVLAAWVLYKLNLSPPSVP
jgi:hypothetical protein